MVQSTLSILSIGQMVLYVKLLTWGDYLCVVSPTEPNPPQVGSMDSTGFEPASATWTECQYIPPT